MFSCEGPGLSWSLEPLGEPLVLCTPFGVGPWQPETDLTGNAGSDCSQAVPQGVSCLAVLYMIKVSGALMQYDRSRPGRQPTHLHHSPTQTPTHPPDRPCTICAPPTRPITCRGLQGILNQRRKLLAYLRRSNFTRYCFVIHQLGLKDVYAKQVRHMF